MKLLKWKGEGGILEVAAEIVYEYETGVTLRQLFYQLVARGYLPNTSGRYNLLSHKSAEARRQGWFPALIDPTRLIYRCLNWNSPAEAKEWLASHYRRDRTEGQKYAIYLAIEKAALVGQLEDWFSGRGIPIMALKGYSSQTHVDNMIEEVADEDRPAVLIYAGDFDPSGMDIERDFLERTACFEKVVRVALNEKQVTQYNLPPQLGKASDTRATSFIEKYGKLIQVELDALSPTVLRGLYKKAIARFWDSEAYDLVMRQEAKDTEELKA